MGIRNTIRIRMKYLTRIKKKNTNEDPKCRCVRVANTNRK